MKKNLYVKICISALCCTAVFGGLTGCSATIEKYQPTATVVHTLKEQNIKPVSVEVFNASPEINDEFIALRGSKFYSPYTKSFASYIAESLKLDLLLAKKLDSKSDIQIGGTLLKNYISTSGNGEISVQYTVNKNGSQVYSKTFSSSKEWEAYFEGSTAFRKVQEVYKELVSDLNQQIINDPEFITILK